MMVLVFLPWAVLPFAYFAVAQIHCAWNHPRAGSVQNALYIDGGQYFQNTWAAGNWTPGGSPHLTYPPAGQLQRFNYSMPFSSDQSTPINITDKMVLMALTAGGSYDAPQYQDGAMFTDDNELYTFGGLAATDVKDDSTILNYQLWPADAQTIFVPGPNIYTLPSGISNYITHGASASIPTEKLAFYFSGKHAAQDSAPTAISATELATSMLKVDMSSQGHANWTRLSFPSEVDARASGQLVWIPVSEKGILLAIGGVTVPMDLNNYNCTGPNDRTANASFTTSIPVFDVSKESWIMQLTSTDPSPGQLADFCAVVADAGDNKFDVFVYGGNNGMCLDYESDELPTQDAVWVLSVPEFVWTRISEGDYAHGRTGHICSTPYPNQMLVAGGKNIYRDDYCIGDGTLLDIFNLNTLEWTHNYRPGVGGVYQRPAAISKNLEGKPSLANSDVSALFATTYPQSIIQYWPYKAQAEKRSSGFPIGGVVGGVVGGIALIAGVLLWRYWPSRRKERERRQSQAGMDTTSWPPRVINYLRTTPDGIPPPKDVISDTTTEVDGGEMSPPLQTAEVGGDYYFQRNRGSVVTPEPQSGRYRNSLSPQHSSLPPRSPRSMSHTGSVEMDGEQVHEVHGESRNSQVSSEGLNQANYHFRAHPLYPHSIDGHLSNTAAQAGPSEPSHPSDGAGHRLLAPSPNVGPSEISENGDIEGTQSSVSDHADTARAVQMTRPGYQRASSSLSEPITPPPVTDRSMQQEMKQRNSIPISPLLNHATPRPAHHRHDSSLSEMLNFTTTAVEGGVPREINESEETTLVNSPGGANLPKRKPLRSAYDENRKQYG